MAERVDLDSFTFQVIDHLPAISVRLADKTHVVFQRQIESPIEEWIACPLALDQVRISE